MLKKLLFLLALVFTLSACGPSVYDQQAQVDAQRTYQNQYSSYDACYANFPYPHDCYMGSGGIWFSPLYYPWGAVIHYNHVVGYGLHVPVGGVWVRPSYRVSVNYGYARGYISQRSTYYHTSSTYNPATRTFTPRSASSLNRSVTPTPYRSSVSSVPPRPTVTAPTRGIAPTTINTPRPANVSRINFGGSRPSPSSSPTYSRPSSSPSYRSSSSSSSSSGRRR